MAVIEGFEERLGERAAKDKDGKNIRVPAGMGYEDWKRKFVDGDGKSGIMISGSGAMSESATISSIESRNTAKGKPNAITIFGEGLNNRQRGILDKLPNDGDTTIINKRDVKMKDLAALTAQEGVEFAMFTRKGERLVVRGNERRVNVTAEAAGELSADGWRWSGHTHPGIGSGVRTPSQGDKDILREFGQANSSIYDSNGRYEVYDKN